jgi:hypothetical protein
VQPDRDSGTAGQRLPSVAPSKQQDRNAFKSATCPCKAGSGPVTLPDLAQPQLHLAIITRQKRWLWHRWLWRLPEAVAPVVLETARGCGTGGYGDCQMLWHRWLWRLPEAVAPVVMEPLRGCGTGGYGACQFFGSTVA